MYLFFIDQANLEGYPCLVSNSKADPIAISRNLLNSISLCLLQPSAMLEGIETADLLIWLLSPKRSSMGKVETILYVETTLLIPSFQISSVLKSLMGLKINLSFLTGPRAKGQQPITSLLHQIHQAHLQSFFQQACAFRVELI